MVRCMVVSQLFAWHSMACQLDQIRRIDHRSRSGQSKRAREVCS